MTDPNETKPKRVQTRRALTVSQECYDAVTKQAEDKGTSRSKVVEAAINSFFDGGTQ